MVAIVGASLSGNIRPNARTEPLGPRIAESSREAEVKGRYEEPAPHCRGQNTNCHSREKPPPNVRNSQLFVHDLGRDDAGRQNHAGDEEAGSYVRSRLAWS